MKKQLRFLYRYLFTTGRWRRLINTHTVMAAFISLVFLTTLAWTPITPERPHGAAQNTALAGAVGAGEAEAAAAEANAAAAAAASGPAQATLIPNDDRSLATTRTPTPFPPEFATNADQTMGVTLAGAALVLIVVVGVLSFLPRKEPRA